jgi:hypothetical protein
LDIALISSSFIRYTVLALFLTLSLIDLIIVDDYYRSVQKTQFREMTAYISADSTERFPIVNEKTSWEQSFYLRKFGNEAPVLTGRKEDIIDSILQESSKDYDLPAFWLVGAHGDERLSAEKHKQLEESYYLVKQKDFHDAWAQLYARKDSALVLDHQYFEPDRIIEIDGEKIIAIWGGSIHTRPVYFENGRYTLIITVRGTPLEGVFPHLNIFANDVKTGDFSLSDTYEDYEFPLILNEDTMVTFRLEMDNDAHNPQTGEDRNALVRYIICKEATQ